MKRAWRDPGRRAWGLTVLALAWAVALIVLALLIPVYSTQRATPPTGAIEPSSSLTFVQVNGVASLIPVAVPALFATLVWSALHYKCARGGRVGGYVAWTLIGVLFAFCVVTSPSIGGFALPVVGLLGLAARCTPKAGFLA